MGARIRFLLEIPFRDREHREHLLDNYGPRFQRLIREAKHRDRRPLPMDVEALPALRALLARAGTVAKLVPEIGGQLPPARLQELVDVAPLFDLAPRDLQAFLLLSIGVRETSRGEKLLPSSAGEPPAEARQE